MLFNQLVESDLPDRPLAILSFDDGYYDFIEYAMPILQKYEINANLNIIPMCLKTGEPIWNVRLYDFLNSAPRKLINEIKFSGFEGSLQSDSKEAKVKYGLKISRYLKNRPRREQENLWFAVEALLQSADFPQTRMIKTEELLALKDDVESGFIHTHTNL